VGQGTYGIIEPVVEEFLELGVSSPELNEELAGTFVPPGSAGELIDIGYGDGCVPEGQERPE
jgi:hypothetical protein